VALWSASNLAITASLTAKELWVATTNVAGDWVGDWDAGLESAARGISATGWQAMSRPANRRITPVRGLNAEKNLNMADLLGTIGRGARGEISKE